MSHSQQQEEQEQQNECSSADVSSAAAAAAAATPMHSGTRLFAMLQDEDSSPEQPPQTRPGESQSSVSSISSSGHTTSSSRDGSSIRAPKMSKRPRRPSLILELSASLQRDAHHNRDTEQHDSHQHAYDWPNFALLFQFTCLIQLTVMLAAAAAWDAQLQCVRHDNDSIKNQLVSNDDYEYAAEDGSGAAAEEEEEDEERNSAAGEPQLTFACWVVSG